VQSHISWALAITLLAGAALASPARAQNSSPQADSANQPKDAPSNPPPKKVYTNDDLRSTDRGGVSVVGNSKAAAKSPQSNSNEPKNERYWHNRAQQLRNRMAEVDHQIAELEASNQSQHPGSGGSNSGNPPPPPPSAYTVGAHVRGGTSTPLERLKDRKAQLQQQMDQLEDEARQAGVPPGWLR
jgi:hypothetical protein